MSKKEHRPDLGCNPVLTLTDYGTSLTEVVKRIKYNNRYGKHLSVPGRPQALITISPTMNYTHLWKTSYVQDSGLDRMQNTVGKGQHIMSTGIQKCIISRRESSSPVG